MASVFQGSDVDDVLDSMFAQIKTHVEHPVLPRSGFTISRILHLDVDFHNLWLTRGSSYIAAPKWIVSKNAIINPKNGNEECFRWAVIASLHYTEVEKDAQRITKLRPYVDLYNWEGIEFPTSIKSEMNNKAIAVNVLYVTGKKINILRRSEHSGRSKQVNLLLMTDDKKTHYTAVKSLSRLLVKSRDKHHGYCKEHGAVKITMPTEAEKWLYYRDGQQQFKVPFAIYADFESLLIPVEDARETKTKKLSKHVPSGWCTHSKFAYGDVPDPLTVYRGEDCMTRFVNHLEDEVKRLYNTYPQQPMLPLTEVLKIKHDEASKCHICMKPFDGCEYSRKVQIIATIRGWYDAHLFILELGEKYDTQDIGCIAENTDKYIIFNVKIKVPLAGMGYGDGEKYKTIEVRFIDPCRFMASSLDKLASSLNDEQCKKGDNVTMGDYHDVYLSTDVLLLADVFETFRDVCLINYKLDPAHFYSATVLA
ncbi:uncharacterized protein LOC130636929 [Hydractinia symbiolongicarpus]|uniref:uncharacterized protein LOC130636929 n=1 Tax=Hydractinia symbiolongicarpus TaxID=13093 RepID=UPI002550AB29|nr:uncharacterized protein LOC130636929 [Hydractinia symbiolongicarpus]